jgi:hypothetical protein
MSVECPAGGCGYTGHLDAVEGHIGGVGDRVHEGVVVADLRKSLHGKASGGLPAGLVLLVVGSVVVVLYLRSQGESGGSEGLNQSESEDIDQSGGQGDEQEVEEPVAPVGAGWS